MKNTYVTLKLYDSNQELKKLTPPLTYFNKFQDLVDFMLNPDDGTNEMFSRSQIKTRSSITDVLQGSYNLSTGTNNIYLTSNVANYSCKSSRAKDILGKNKIYNKLELVLKKD